MEKTSLKVDGITRPEKKKKFTVKKMIEQKYLILMSLPFVIWLIIFKYIPLWGWTMSFQNYKPNLSFSEQKWVGLNQFKTLFADKEFYQAMRNTLVFSILGITIGFIIPIIFAILINEIRTIKFKKSVQTISYLPHFISWVIAASIITSMLSTTGPINALLIKIGLIHKPILYLSQPKLFYFVCLISDIWKETGWNAIIYLAAITGIDTEIYEAAKVDGANRFQQAIHVTLPGIRPTVMVLLIMSIGSLINIGFEKQMLLGNPLVRDYSNVLDLYILNYGITLFKYSYGTAIGMFKSLISIALLFIANTLAKKFGDGGVI